jgi:elongation factor G
MRNIGISAHIDSGKTTLTERILFYTGRISEIHDVKGRDGVGATMDHMDLEREKGITIQSAATYCRWGENHINIIDTPGHVDFTIEVERALRVLDGAVLVLCGVSGVQSQTLTVDRQMKRYSVPRLAFINKLDRMGANPWKVIEGIRAQLRLSAAAVQIPIGTEDNFEGVVCLLTKKSARFTGEKGSTIEIGEVPGDLVPLMEEKRKELVERLAELDDDIAEAFLNEQEPTLEQMKTAIRRLTVERKFVPVFMGSAYKNKGVQLLLDGVNDYLPAPVEVKNHALDLEAEEKKVDLVCFPDAPLVALAFKLEESRFGQLTYIRIYQGTLRKGMSITNVKTGKKVKIPRIVRMHSNQMEDVESVGAGDVCALFGLECASMDTFGDGSKKYAMTSMFVPNPVMSLKVKPKESAMLANFGKAIGKFSREDPTLRVSVDSKTKETIMSGMVSALSMIGSVYVCLQLFIPVILYYIQGELHLEIYVERLKREFNVECITGSPSVSFKETVSTRGNFNYLHKKQSGGSGQYARVIGHVEPLEEDEIKKGITFLFENQVIGTNVPVEFIPSCEKGAAKAVEEGVLAGHPLTGVRVVLTDGAAHTVDSNDTAFQTAIQYGIREAVRAAKPQILEPIMNLEVVVPTEFQGNIIGALNKRNGMIMATDLNEDGSLVTVKADVPLVQMFGYSTDLRSSTQGKGEFAMEYKSHEAVSKSTQEELIKAFQNRAAEEEDF